MLECQDAQDDDPDSAIESDTETTLEVRKRRFSQQISCMPEESKPRSRTFLRQESLFVEENKMQSELSIAGDVQQVEVYVSFSFTLYFMILGLLGLMFEKVM